MILSNSEKNLQDSINVWNEEFKRFKLSVNILKTVTMIIANIYIDNAKVKQTSNFKYLGSVLKARGDMEPEMNKRIISIPINCTMP